MVLPGQMSKLGVDRAGHHLCVDSMELVHTITESNYLSGADKRAAKDAKAHSTHPTNACDTIQGVSQAFTHKSRG